MKDKNPPAFPRPDTDHGSYGHHGHDGMTLRDWFAGQALASAAMTALVLSSKDPSQTDAGAINGVVTGAYAIADAMLAHRQKGQSDAA
jgi:hypothetical protein